MRLKGVGKNKIVDRICQVNFFFFWIILLFIYGRSFSAGRENMSSSIGGTNYLYKKNKYSQCPPVTQPSTN